ncbi:hypothetical protein ACHAXR_000939, partial [Thalassiosira sp. AJA248-18]
TAPFFAPLERAIRNDLIPSLLKIPRCEVTAKFCNLLSQSVKKGGLGLRNPVDTASCVHKASKSATSHLTESLVDEQVAFDFRTHRERAEYYLQRARKQRLEREQDFLDGRAEGASDVKRRDLCNCSNGAWAWAWVRIIPSRLNGTNLSADECRDNWRLRYNLAPLDMPQHYDGCSARMTVEHALSCKVGGLVHIRHNDVADEFRHLCGTA